MKFNTKFKNLPMIIFIALLLIVSSMSVMAETYSCEDDGLYDDGGDCLNKPSCTAGCTVDYDSTITCKDIEDTWNQGSTSYGCAANKVIVEYNRDSHRNNEVIIDGLGNSVISCSGCYVASRYWCYEVGQYYAESSSSGKYCGIDKQLHQRKQIGESCSKFYHCQGPKTQCSNNICIADTFTSHLWNNLLGFLQFR